MIDSALYDLLTDDNANIVILDEIEYHDGTGVKTAYVSTDEFSALPTDTVPNKEYNDVLREIPEISSRIDTDIAVGEVTIINNGELNDWYTWAWSGHRHQLYIGDASWSRDQFKPLYSGITEELTSVDAYSISFSLRDKRHLLDQAILTDLNNGKKRKLALGRVFNAAPVVLDPINRRLQLSDHGMFPDVRDNGVTVIYTDNGDGTVTLDVDPSGEITCDFSDGIETAGDMIEWLALRAGLSAAEIDKTYPSIAPLQLVIDEGETYADVFTRIMNSVGGHWRFNRTGVLELRRKEAPKGGTNVTDIDGDQIKVAGVRLVSSEPPVSKVILKYAINNNPQSVDNLAGSLELTPTRIDLYSSEYQLVESKNPGINDIYPLADVLELNTLFVNKSDAQSEAERVAVLFNKRRDSYELDGFSVPFMLNIGDEVKVTDESYRFQNSENTIVIGMDEKISDQQAVITVWL